jgi:hypothetical protein
MPLSEPLGMIHWAVCELCGVRKKKVKISLLQAVKAPRVLRGWGSHIS